MKNRLFKIVLGVLGVTIVVLAVAAYECNKLAEEDLDEEDDEYEDEDLDEDLDKDLDKDLDDDDDNVDVLSEAKSVRY